MLHTRDVGEDNGVDGRAVARTGAAALNCFVPHCGEWIVGGIFEYFNSANIVFHYE